MSAGAYRAGLQGQGSLKDIILMDWMRIDFFWESATQVGFLPLRFNYLQQRCLHGRHKSWALF